MSRQPNENDLFDYMEGNLPPENHAAVKKYLEEHEDCRAALESAKVGAKAFEAFKITGSIDLVSDIMEKIDSPTALSTSYLRYGILASILIIIIVISIAFLNRSESQSPVAPVAKPEVQPSVPQEQTPIVIAQQPDTHVQPSVPALPAKLFELAANEQKVIQSELIGTILFAGPGKFLVTENNVKITHGRALFTILSRAGKNPFTVSTENATITVIGTVFGVNKDRNDTRVILLKGRLRIDHLAASQTLNANFSAKIVDREIIIEKATSREIEFWSSFPDSCNKSGLIDPVIATDAATTAPIEQSTPDNENPITNPSESLSPMDLLNDWSIKQPDTGQ